MLESAELAKGNKGRRYTVHRTPEQRWTDRLPFANRPPGYSFTIPPRDNGGFAALDEIRGKGINLVANAVAQSADHIKSFFAVLRLELAFYLGCLNLHARLREKGEPTCFPTPLADGGLTLTAQGIYDVCLTLHLDDRAVGNDVDADGRSLVMITGANQGGKSTLLRSLGVAQLMMQSGMFVGGESLRANSAPASSRTTSAKRTPRWRAASSTRNWPGSARSPTASVPTASCSATSRSPRPTSASRPDRAPGRRAMLDKEVRVLFVTPCTTSRTASTRSSWMPPSSSAPSGNPTAGVRSGPRGRAAAHQLRRKLLPPYLRQRDDSAGAEVRT